MRKYSQFFQTLHDEKKPTGDLGRGTHYSILRAIVFTDHHARPLPVAHHSDFAVIWDEDHDERVIQAIEEVYFAGHLSTFIAFGERKGGFTAVLRDDYFPRWKKDRFHYLEAELAKICDMLPDTWISQIHNAQMPGGLIASSSEDAILYLSNLKMLWKLGHKPIVRVR